MSNELPKFGNGTRGKFRYDKEKRCMVPCDEARRISKAHGVITDEMEPIESMATPHREIFTSKSKYRQHLRALGFRETGGAHLQDIPSAKEEEEKTEKEIREDIEKAYYDVKYDRVEFTEAEKEKHRREEREWEKNGMNWKLRAPH